MRKNANILLIFNGKLSANRKQHKNGNVAKDPNNKNYLAMCYQRNVKIR